MNRFPRLRINQEIRLNERILLATYNSLVRRRASVSNRWARTKYDVCKMGQWKKTAPTHFLVLASLLSREGIDPALFLKVLSQYGKFRHSKYLPPPKWLLTDDALEKYRWLLYRDRETYPVKKDWKSYLNGKPSEGTALNEAVLSSIRQSASIVEGTIKTFQVKLLSAVFAHLDHLSPWYLAVCPMFLHRMGTVSLLRRKTAMVIMRCIDALLKRPRLLKLAVETYCKSRR